MNYHLIDMQDTAVGHPTENAVRANGKIVGIFFVLSYLEIFEYEISKSCFFNWKWNKLYF